jgi:hypothetical protein
MRRFLPPDPHAGGAATPRFIPRFKPWYTPPALTLPDRKGAKEK